MERPRSSRATQMLLRTCVFLVVATLPRFAAAFQVVTSGPTVGQIVRNLALQVSGMVSAAEGYIYFAGICFFGEAIRRIVNHEKHNNYAGRGMQEQGWVITYWLCLVAAVLCFAAPTMIGSGIQTLFGAPAQTVKAPEPSFSPS